LFDDSPVALVLSCALAHLDELFLVNAQIFKQSLEQVIDQLSEIRMNLMLFLKIVILLFLSKLSGWVREILAIAFNKRLNWCLPPWTHEKCEYGIKNPILSTLLHFVF